jgi:hypothetical protein
VGATRGGLAQRPSAAFPGPLEDLPRSAVVLPDIPPHEAANASEAMDSLQSEFTVDLLFTDINLGKGMNGIELALWAGEFAAPKDPGDDRRHIENGVSPGSGSDIGEAVRSQRPAGARETRAGDVIILVVPLRLSPKGMR